MPGLVDAIAELSRASIRGRWFRHVPSRIREHLLDGRVAPSRWGSKPGFPILYLGQPESSVIVEGYRHFVDPVEDVIIDQLTPRRMVVADVSVTNLLDLRTAAARVSTGLSLPIMESATDDTDAYAQCRHVAAAAHQLGAHGVIAPAATQMGHTLALFTRNLPIAERPEIVEDYVWDRWPDDPRQRTAHLRVVRADED